MFFFMETVDDSRKLESGHEAADVHLAAIGV